MLKLTAEGCGEFNSSALRASSNPLVAAFPALFSPSIKTKLDAYAFSPKVVLVLDVLPPTIL